MDRKPIPSTFFYPEETAVQRAHKLAHLVNDIRDCEHPDDKKQFADAIKRLERVDTPEPEPRQKRSKAADTEEV